MDPNSSKGTAFIFSTDKSNPNRVYKMLLDLTNFALTVSTANGSVCTLTEQDEVQHTLDQAHVYNKHVTSLLKEGTLDQEDKISIEIALDPVNTIKTFTCSV
jgi:hypothetical protein